MGCPRGQRWGERVGFRARGKCEPGTKIRQKAANFEPGTDLRRTRADTRLGIFEGGWHGFAADRGSGFSRETTDFA
ncbi:hypothetical protein SBA3_370025 [Candidatus Sulfopaludibacter sp. SbA3]|nr:hypothetical protein SBA3_370025 [Candidatus Sulfopaludibacter sp. SbA3]